VTTHWYMPEPCDTAEPELLPVPACGWLDLVHQIPDTDLMRIEDVTVRLEGVL